MFKIKDREVHRHQLNPIIKNKGIKTSEGLLDLLYGDSEGWIDSEYRIIQRYHDEPKANILRRLNVLWVYPVYLVFFAPVRWLLYGDKGVSEFSRFGKFLRWLTGELK